MCCMADMEKAVAALVENVGCGNAQKIVAMDGFIEGCRQRAAAEMEAGAERGDERD